MEHVMAIVNDNKAISFDGIDDYVVIPNSDAINFDNNQNFTVELWVKIDPNQVDLDYVDNDILEKWSNAAPGTPDRPYPFVIRYFRDTNTIQAARYDGTNGAGAVSITKFNDGQYHHIAFVKDGSTLKLYIDGQLESSATDTTTGSTQNSSPLFVGRRGPSTYGPFDNHLKGEVDELRIWNVARTEKQIKGNLNRELTGKENGLVGYWKFNGSNNNIAQDLTGNNNDGILQNGAVKVESVAPIIVSATDGNDVINGTNKSDKIAGLAGNDSLTGLGGNDNLDGGAGNDNLNGGLGKDKLTGGAGNDNLNGGLGKDKLTGGTGKDSFQFDSKTQGVDIITDFASAPDTIRLKASGFGSGLTKGVLAQTRLVLGSAAEDKGDRIIYDSSTGALFFDEDGKGGSPQIQFATLQNKPTIVRAADFVLF
jgi:Ca2+-binding RTX toxin-like protein